MAVLLGTVALTVASGIVAAASGILLWSVKQIRPVWKLEEDVEALSAQVTKLRTRKAAAASPRTKPSQAAGDIDPRLAGLNPQQKALFTGFPFEDGDFGEEEIQ